MDELVKRAIRKYRRDRKDLDTVASDKSYSDKIGPENYVILVNDELRPFVVYVYAARSNRLFEMPIERWPKEIWRGFIAHQADLGPSRNRPGSFIAAMKWHKVLVVEDEVLVGYEMVATLRRAGIEAVGPAPTIDAALAAIKREECDAALLDINLNGFPSFSVAEALRQNGTPFAFVTAYPRLIVPQELRDAPLLAKPYEDRQLLSVARYLLGMSEES